jgi:GNAT superfamily N-acetyltransferase
MEDSAFEIRLFREEDFATLVPAWHETNRASYWYVEQHQKHTLEDAQRFFRNVLLAECRIWVACVDSEPVALVAWDSRYIRQFAVVSGMRNRGIGSALLRHLLDQTTGEVRLYTFQRNAGARRFYERNGFRALRFGVSPAPESEPDVEYVLHRAGD